MCAANTIGPPTAAPIAANPVPPRNPRREMSGPPAEYDRVGALGIVGVELRDQPLSLAHPGFPS